MKMKQKLAATLAGVMALSMVPATSVFAYSTNKASREIKGAEKLNLGKGDLATDLILEVTGEIKKNDTFILTNTKADFENSTLVEEVKDADGKVTTPKVTVYQSAGDWVYYLSGKQLHVKYTGDTVTLNKEKFVVPIDLKEVKGEGDIVITVDSNGTAITSGDVVVGTIVGKGVTASLKSASFAEGKYEVQMGKLTLSETTRAMLPSDQAYITLRLSNDDLSFIPFEKIDNVKDWGSKATDLWVSEDGKTIKTATDATDDKALETKYKVADVTWKGVLGATGLVDGDKAIYASADGMSLYVPVSLISKTTSVGNIEFEKLITVYKNPDVDYVGDVKVRIMDKWVEEGKTYGEAVGLKEEAKPTIISDVEQAIKVTVAKATELVAGKLNEKDNYGNSTHLTAKISVREDAIGSIDKEIKFELPEGVKVLGYKEGKKNKEITSIEVNGTTKALKYDAKYVEVVSQEEDMSRPYRPQVVVEVKDGRTAKAEIDLELYLSVSADYEYDTVDVEYSTTVSESFEKEEGVLTIATVKKPVEVYAVSTVIDSSLKKQELGEVVIKENFKGALTSGGYVYIELEDGVYFNDEKGEIKVDGDVSTGRLKFYEVTDKTADNYGEIYKVGFYIDEASTKASTITVSGLQTSTRNLAGGYYELKVYGDAIAANDIEVEPDQTADISTDTKKERAAKADAIYFNAGTLVVEDYVTVDKELLNETEKAPEANNKVETQKVTLKKGDLTYTKADGTKGTMVAAPYFNYDANGGGITMVPIRAIGEILGAEVEWSQATQTATFTMADGRMAQITLGSPVARAVDGSTLTMNWAAEIPAGVDGGIYAPIRYMATVLGFSADTVSYDYANQCVVINAPVK